MVLLVVVLYCKVDKSKNKHRLFLFVKKATVSDQDGERGTFRSGFHVQSVQVTLLLYRGFDTSVDYTGAQY